MTARSYHHLFTHGHRSIRHLMLGGTMLVTVAVGLVTPPTILADGCPTTEVLAAHGALSPEARHIALLEGRDPANCPAGDTTAFVPTSQEALHIQLLEGRDLANVPATAMDDSDAVAVSADGPHASHTAY